MSSSSSSSSPTFDYVRPDLGSLHPETSRADCIRLACLALDVASIAGIVRISNQLPFVEYSIDTIVVLFAKGIGIGIEMANTAGIEDELRRYIAIDCVLVCDVATGNEDKAAESVLGALKALHTEYAVATALTVERKDGSQAITHTSWLHDIGRWNVQESWPMARDWDILTPPLLTHAQLRNGPPPAISMLSRRGVRELLAMAERGSGGKKWAIYHGPTAAERFEMWNGTNPRIQYARVEGGKDAASIAEEDRLLTVIAERNIVRRRLARHILRTYPGILVDMEKDPVCPWKGMRFFHGSPNATIQDGPLQREATRLREEGNKARKDVEDKRAEVNRVMSILDGSDETDDQSRLEAVLDDAKAALDEAAEEQQIAEDAEVAAAVTAATPISGLHASCMLGWTETIDKEAETSRSLTAFTSPVFAESCAYGSHVYTYSLNCEGKTLQMLDMRNDYDTSTLRHDALDNVSIVFELSGIRHENGKWRRKMAAELHELFHDSSIDGAIMNSDVEWMWFNPQAVLDWVQPADHADMAKPADLTSVLLDAKGVAKDGLHRLPAIGRFVDMAMSSLDMRKFTRSDKCTALEITLSDLPITRWTMDTAANPFMPQFAASAASASASGLWTSFQLPANELSATRTLHVFECSYNDLWDAVGSGLGNMRMTDHLMDGVQVRHHETDFLEVIPFRKLCSRLRAINAILLVLLPNGHTQIVPPIKHENRFGGKTKFIARVLHQSAPGAKFVDMPVRKEYAAKHKHKRKADDDDDDDKENIKNSKQKTGGRAKTKKPASAALRLHTRLVGRLCIC